jgi:hypothetical protein
MRLYCQATISPQLPLPLEPVGSLDAPLTLRVELSIVSSALTTLLPAAIGAEIDRRVIYFQMKHSPAAAEDELRAKESLNKFKSEWYGL